jgi:hypothetical protein
MNWNPDKHLVKNTREAMSYALEHNDVLEALHMLGHLQCLESVTCTDIDDIGFINDESILSRIDVGRLWRAHKTLTHMDKSDELLLSTCKSTEYAIFDILDERDYIKLVLLGIEAAESDKRPTFYRTINGMVRDFDYTVSANLWKLVRYNRRRRAKLQWIAPEYRKRFWWYEQGSELNENTISYLEDVTRLVKAFPSVAGRIISFEGTWIDLNIDR